MQITRYIIQSKVLNNKEYKSQQHSNKDKPEKWRSVTYLTLQNNAKDIFKLCKYASKIGSYKKERHQRYYFIS